MTKLGLLGYVKREACADTPSWTLAVRKRTRRGLRAVQIACIMPEKGVKEMKPIAQLGPLILSLLRLSFKIFCEIKVVPRVFGWEVRIFLLLLA